MKTVVVKEPELIDVCQFLKENGPSSRVDISRHLFRLVHGRDPVGREKSYMLQRFFGRRCHYALHAGYETLNPHILWKQDDEGGPWHLTKGGEEYIETGKLPSARRGWL